MVMGSSKNLHVFNFAILLKLRKFDAREIYSGNCDLSVQTIFEVNSTSRTQAFAVMKEKRSHDELVIARKQRGTSQPGNTVQSDDNDALNTATLATDADVQVTSAVTYSPCDLHQLRFLQCRRCSMMHGNGNS